MSGRTTDKATAGRPVVMDPATSFRRLVPVSKLQEFITPVESVYVIAHMGVARVDSTAWRLRVDGMVDRSVVLDYEELKRLPAQEVTAVIECFGNPLEPSLPTRRAANVTWRGVRLADLLVRGGAQHEASCVWLEGLDAGTFAGEHLERYVKDIPLSRARQPDVLVAYAMNGEPLTHEHGFPARAFIPGYFGTNAVKWLTRITLEATRPVGLFTTRLYNRSVGGESEQAMEPARELDVQSVIVRPADGSRLSPGAHQITGWAWGAWPITGVDVSFDGGATWDVAELRERGNTPTWQRFAFNWVATRGTHEIRCRAADSLGRIQLTEGRNSMHAITVTIG